MKKDKTRKRDMNAAERMRKVLEKRRMSQVGASGRVYTPEVNRKSAEEFSARIIGLTNYSRWDFIKIVPNGVYNQEAYGSDIGYLSGNIPLGNLHTKQTMKFSRYLVQNEGNMETLPVINMAENPVYRRETAVVRKLWEHYQGTVLIAPTIFLLTHTIPEFCEGIERARYYLDRHLDAIGEMLKAFVQMEFQLMNTYTEAGVDDFFFAIRYGNGDILSEEEFERFCRLFNEQLLVRAERHTWFNMVHIHGMRNLYMERFDSYDVQAIGWENTPGTAPEGERFTMKKVREITGKILVTGTDQLTGYYGIKEEVRERFRKRLEAAAGKSGGNRFIFTPGCSLSLDISLEHVHPLREVVDEYSEKPWPGN